MQNGGIHYPVRYTSDIVAYTPATKILEEVPMNWDRKMLKDLFNDDVEMTPFIGGVYALLADGTNPKLAKYIKTDSGWEMMLLKARVSHSKIKTDMLRPNAFEILANSWS